ncbi:hypothetical protein F4677DRAFT_459113 [Hypoxylon crocopeplum]|nr:hypothetical protein F4677DRAFT_459113 [Hypoxylon crocopeplum]
MVKSVDHLCVRVVPSPSPEETPPYSTHPMDSTETKASLKGSRENPIELEDDDDGTETGSTGFPTGYSPGFRLPDLDYPLPSIEKDDEVEGDRLPIKARIHNPRSGRTTPSYPKPFYLQRVQSGTEARELDYRCFNDVLARRPDYSTLAVKTGVDSKPPLRKRQRNQDETPTKRRRLAEDSSETLGQEDEHATPSTNNTSNHPKVAPSNSSQRCSLI